MKTQIIFRFSKMDRICWCQIVSRLLPSPKNVHLQQCQHNHSIRANETQCGKCHGSSNWDFHGTENGKIFFHIFRTGRKFYCSSSRFKAKNGNASIVRLGQNRTSLRSKQSRHFFPRVNVTIKPRRSNQFIFKIGATSRMERFWFRHLY